VGTPDTVVEFRKIEIKKLPTSEPVVPQREPEDQGWVPLFNGKDLSGWEGDKKFWTWKDGELVGITRSGKGLKKIYLWSTRKHRDFEMKFQIRLKGGVGKSGVTIRSLAPLEDPAMDAQVKESVDINPSVFNDYYIRCRGRHVTMRVNGFTVADRLFQDLPLEGVIKFYVQTGTEATFKNILIRELPPASLEGFVPLFNGKDLSGWKTHPAQPGNWRVENRILTGSGDFSYLFSERGDFENFHLRVEAKIGDGGKSGVHFRARFGANIPDGYEAMINGEEAELYKTGSLFTHPGSKRKWNLHHVEKEVVFPDTWFSQEVIAIGNHLVIKVNGKTLADVKDDSHRKGHFALQTLHRATTVHFRKIEIKELPATPKRDSKSIAGAWDSDWGSVTLEHGPLEGNKPIVVTGSWKSANSHGVIESGTYNPAAGTLVLTYVDQAEVDGSSAVECL